MLDLHDLLAASALTLPVIALIAVLAYLLSLWGTPVARAAAIRFGIVDRPDGRLKQQREPVPYLGGLAVYFAVLVSLLIAFSFNNQLLALLLAGSLALLLGLVDDLGALTPKVKFFGQLLVVWVLLKAGVATNLTYLPLWLNIMVTVFWLVTVVNAVNIIDIMDGLAAAVVSSAAAVLVVIALVNEEPVIAATSAALFGATAGFLHYNRQPARIYLGDSGSLFLGLMLGGLTMLVRYGEHNELAVLSPLLVLCVPLFDLTFVSLLRMHRGESPFRGSPDHFALRLRKRGLSDTRIVVIAAAATLAGGGLTLVSMGLGWEESLSLYVVVAALLLGVALWLGRVKV